MNTCSKCKEEKSISEFSPHKASPGGLLSWCKQCNAKAKKSRYWLMSPEERKAYNAKGRANKTKAQIRADNQRFYAKHKKKMRAEQGARYHGITPEEYVERRKLPCEICGRFSERTEGRGSGQHIDHDHKTNKLRGTLCEKCNRGLGHYDDDPKQLRAAALYLEKYLV